eukprot:1136233-Pelagomonas_calceolata.AAC.4
METQLRLQKNCLAGWFVHTRHIPAFLTHVTVITSDAGLLSRVAVVRTSCWSKPPLGTLFTNHKDCAPCTWWNVRECSAMETSDFENISRPRLLTSGQPLVLPAPPHHAKGGNDVGQDVPEGCAHSFPFEGRCIRVNQACNCQKQ